MHFRYAKMHSLMNPATETPSNSMGPFVESRWPNMILTAGVRFSGRENLVHHSHLPASSPVVASLPTATAALAANLFNRADRPQFHVRPSAVLLGLRPITGPYAFFAFAVVGRDSIKPNGVCSWPVPHERLSIFMSTLPSVRSFLENGLKARA